jgi:hypothetical protein
MFQPIRYVGLDVSKETIAVAVAEPDGSVVEYGDIPTTRARYGGWSRSSPGMPS